MERADSSRNISGEQHEDQDGIEREANTEASGAPIRMAQANQGDQGGIDLTKVTQSLTATAGATLTLPPGITLDQIVIIGNNWYLIQADGSLIEIINAGLFPPSLIVGGVTVPSEALVAALEGASEGVPTAGPPVGGGPNQSSGINAAVDPGDIGPGAELVGLLGPEALQFFVPVVEQREQFTQLEVDESIPGPTIGDPERGFVEEDDLPNNIILLDREQLTEGLSLNGGESEPKIGNDELNFDAVTNVPITDAYTFTGNLDVNFNGIAGTITFVPVATGTPFGLTSNNQPVLVQLLNDKTLIGYVDVGGTGAFDDGDHLIFEVVLTDPVDPSTPGGEYTINIFCNLDHSVMTDHGEPDGDLEPDVNTDPDLPQGFEEFLTLIFAFEATNPGGTATGQFSVDWQDDGPIIGGEGGEGGPPPTVVDEDGETTSDGLPNSNPGGPGDFLFKSLTAGGDLNILWGSDHGNDNSGNTFGDRMAFFSPDDAAMGVQTFTARDNRGIEIPLQAIVFNTTTNAYEQVLVDIAGAGTDMLTGTATDSSGVTHDVFMVTLSDVGQGSYLFTLKAPLVHQFTDADSSNDGPETSFEDLLIFNFSFTAKDSDGDTIWSEFTVFVNDDSPAFGSGFYLFSTTMVTHDESEGLQTMLDGDDSTPTEDDDDDVAFSTLPAAIQAAFGTTDGDGVLNKGFDPHIANKDTGDAIGYASSGSSLVQFPGLGADFGADGPFGGTPASGTTFALNLGGATGPVATSLETTEGLDIALFLENGVIVGRFDSNGAGGITADDDAAFAIAIDPDTGETYLVQYVSLLHPSAGDGTGGTHDELVSLSGTPVAIEVTFTDGDGDAISDSLNIGDRIKFEDDGPVIDIAGAEGMLGKLNLDETFDPDDPDNYGPGDVMPFDNNGENDDTGPGVADPTGTIPFGMLMTAEGAPGGLFTVTKDAGSDGEQSDIRTLSLVLKGTDGNPVDQGVGVKTTLSVTQPAPGGNPDSDGVGGDFTPYDNAMIYLFLESGVIVGRVGLDFSGADVADPNGDIVFKISLSGSDPLTAKLVAEQFMAIDHPTTPDTFDEELMLAIDNATSPDAGVNLVLSGTITDGDDDTATDMAMLNITGAFKFDDDGPIADLDPASGMLVLDESLGVVGSTKDEPGNAQPDDEAGIVDPFALGNPLIGFNTAALGTLFADNSDAGMDGGASAYALTDSTGGSVTGIDSGLVDTATGNTVFLFTSTQNGLDVIFGLEGTSLGDAQSNGDVVFILHVDPATGEVTAAQYRAVVHDDVNDHDEGNDDGTNAFDDPAVDESPDPEQQTINADEVYVKVAVTDGDGDMDMDLIEIGSLIKFEDDGPHIVIGVNSDNLENFVVGLDESISTNGSPTTPDESGMFGADDDQIGILEQVNGIDAIGSKSSAAGLVAGLFTEIFNDPGADGEKSQTDEYTLTLRRANGSFAPDIDATNPLEFNSTNGVETTLQVTMPAPGGNPAAPSMLSRTIWLFQTDATTIEGRIDTDGDTLFDSVAFRIDVFSGPNPTLRVQQVYALDHPDTGDFDDKVTLDIAGVNPEDNAGVNIFKSSTLTDRDDDFAFSSAEVNVTAGIQFEDDGPLGEFVELDAQEGDTDALRLNLDETWDGVPNPPDGDDTYGPGDTLFDDNGDLDDINSAFSASSLTTALGDVATAAFGSVMTDPGDVENFFTVATDGSLDFGTDGADPDTPIDYDVTLVFKDAQGNPVAIGPDNPVKTNLVVTAVAGTDLESLGVTQRTVWLFEENGVIVGRIGRNADGTDDATVEDFIALTIEVENGANLASQTLLNDVRLTVNQVIPVDHDASDTITPPVEIPSQFDEQFELRFADTTIATSLDLKLTGVIRDGDGDEAVDMAMARVMNDTFSFVRLDDDGPSLVANSMVMATVDEAGQTGGRDLLFFSADGDNPDDGDVGVELYVHDPVLGTTTLVENLNIINVGSNPSVLTPLDGKLYFNGTVNGIGAGSELYVHDPVAGTTTLVADLHGTTSSNPQFLTPLDGRLFFRADGDRAPEGDVGRELYVHDPADNSTTLVADLNIGPDNSNPSQFTIFDGRLFFTAFDGSTGIELYVHDPVLNTTTLVEDLNDVDFSGAQPRSLTVVDGKLFFVADGNVVAGDDVGTELFVHDPVAGTTTLTRDLFDAPGAGSFPDQFTVLGGKLFFVADGDNGTDVDVGRELFVHDTATGLTTLVEDLNSGSGDSDPSQFKVFDDRLFFTANDGTTGIELYVHDPVADTTTLVADLNDSAPVGSNPLALTVLDGKLYFQANGNSGGNDVGRELFVHDPVTGTTTLVADLNTGGDSFAAQFTALDGKLFFRAVGDNVGNELFVHDPVAGTTTLVRDLADAPNANSNPFNLFVTGGKLFFTADGDNAIDGDVGRELYVHDPVTGMTTLARDINAGAGSPFPADPRDISFTTLQSNLPAPAILSLLGLVDFGADGPGGFFLKDATQLGPNNGPLAVMASDETAINGVPVSPVTSMGDPVLFTGFDASIAGLTTLTATAGTGVDERDIFTLTVTEDGTAIFILLGKIDHPFTDSDFDNDGFPEIAFADRLFFDFGALINAVDGDGDAVMLNGQVIFKVLDGLPEAFTPKDAFVLNGQGEMATLDLQFEESAGVDGVGDVVFTLVDGALATDSEGNLITSGGENVVLTGNGTNTLTGTLATAGTVAFTIVLDPVTDTYKVTILQPLGNGIGFSQPDLAGAINGGNPLFAAVGANDGGGVDLFLSSPSGSTINTSQGRIGLGGGQSIDDGEDLLIEFLTNVDQTDDGGPDIPLGGGFFADSRFQTTSFQQEVNRITGQGVASLTVAALLIGGVDPNITRLVIFDENDAVVVDTTTSQTVGGLTGSIAGGTATIVGIEEGWSYFIETSGPMNGVQIEGHDSDSNTANNDDDAPFTLGALTLGGSDAEPFDINADILGTDGDGDGVLSQLQVSVLPDNGDNFVGTENDDLALTGNANDNIIAGLGGDDVILALGGNDTIFGGAGNDTIDGGTGDDTQSGGMGDDTFVVTEFNVNDLIADYDFNNANGNGNDEVDLTALFDLASAIPLIPGELETFVQYDNTTGVLSIDDDGPMLGGVVFVDAVTVTTDGVNAPTNVTIIVDDGFNDVSVVV